MDKYEYRVRLDEIHKCIDDGDYQQAAELADSIDWTRVKSVMTLCTISDLYKIERRFKDSRDILLMAYDRNPNGRLIIYSLCELSIKLNDFVSALQYYNKFSGLAPNDSRIYILKYRLYEAQNVPLEERIEVLEELKKKELKDKWLYELAYLYHRVGLETKCVEECDEVFTLFGEGRFVMKALELKKLHALLTPQQQYQYDVYHNIPISEQPAEVQNAGAETVGAYNAGGTYDAARETSDIPSSTDTADLMSSPTARLQTATENEEYAQAPSDDDISVKPIDMNNPYNTINLQQALAADMKQVLDDGEVPPKTLDDMIYGDSESDVRSDDGDYADNGNDERYSEETRDNTSRNDNEDKDEEQEAPGDRTRIYKPVGMQSDAVSSSTVSFEEAHKVIRQMEDETAAMKAITDEQANSVPGARTGVLTPLNTTSSGFDDVLSQESDGQISLVMPDSEAIEKQITGQLSISDIMSEWEQMKQDNEKKRMNEVRQRILQNTGNLFDDFDEETKNGLLEQLEKAFVAAIMKESKEKGEAPDTAILSDEEIERETKKAVRQATEPLPVITDEDLANGNESAEASADGEDESDRDEGAGDDGVEEIEEIEDDQDASDGKDDEDNGISDEDEADAVEDTSEEDDGADTENEEASESEDDEEDSGDEEEDDAGEDNTDEAADEDSGSEDNSENAGSDDNKNRTAADDKAGQHELSDEEKKTYSKFIQHRRQREQLLDIIDKMSMASYTGNVIITGEEESVALSLTMKLIHTLKTGDSNFLGKVAKISGNAVNKKEASDILDKIEGGALIITHASGMSPKSMQGLLGALESDSRGLIVFLLDSKDRIDRMTDKIPKIKDSFCSRVDLAGLDDDSLVEYAKKYAEEREYSIDEFGVLALHTRIENMQSNDHTVTVSEVKGLVDEAIGFAEKKNPKHFMDTLFGKRFDDDDMVILHENDFMHDV